MNNENKTIKIGDRVLWRGAWGKDAPRIATVLDMELCEQPRMKYGIPTNEIFYRDKDRTVFTLNNGSWAYGFQIEPTYSYEELTNQEGVST